MKRLLILLGISVFGAVVVCALVEAYWFWSGSNFDGTPVAHEASKPRPPMKPLPDVDALARRMLSEQDVYMKLRDEALAAYSKQHPGAHSFDDEARETLKLASYLLVWDDFYGEGLRPMLAGHAEHLESEGCHDPVWLSLRDIVWVESWNSNTDAAVNEKNADSNRLGASPYPAAFRLAACRMAMRNMLAAKVDDRIKSPLSSLSALPEMTGKVTNCYGELIAEHYPDWFLYEKARALLSDAKDDESTLEVLSKGLDEAWQAHDRNNPTADVLDALFYIDKAWAARGGGYSNTVSDESWKIFGDNMKNAQDLLTQLYERAPKQPGLARYMMSIAQGLQLPRDQMELWFQRALQSNPNDYPAYSLKEYFLLPRWYGTEDDEWAFGMDCAKGGNWAAKIPLIIIDELNYRFEAEPDVYSRDDIWKPLETIYREFLDRYPSSISYRSRFARDAVRGEHWAVAKEQFKILGDDWDPDIFSTEEYADAMRKVNAH